MQDILQDFGNTHRIAGPELQQDLPCISNLDNLCLFVMACAKLMITKLVRNAIVCLHKAAKSRKHLLQALCHKVMEGEGPSVTVSQAGWGVPRDHEDDPHGVH